jgi:hypothetical protein
MYMSFATHIHVTRIAAMRIIFTRIGCTLLTCDMYMCRERHIHDPVLSSLKIVKRMKDNEMRYVIHDTRISSGQCPRRDVTVWYGLQGHMEYTPEERHIHVNMHTLAGTPSYHAMERNYKGTC